MNEKLVSVLVPVYNTEKYLEKCLDSIINQTYTNLEIILVDDGSTDNSGKICDAYAERDVRIKVIHKHNEGLVRARKTGLENATGEYIAFVDSDDWIEPNMYEEMLEKALETDADFVESGYLEFHEYTEKTMERKLAEGFFDLRGGGIADHVRAYMGETKAKITPLIWSKMYKADVIRQSYFFVPDNQSIGEDDANYVNLIILANSCFCMEKCFYHYFMRKDSMCHDFSISVLRAYLRLSEYQIDILQSKCPFVKQSSIDVWYYKRLRGLLERLYAKNYKSDSMYVARDIEMFRRKKVVLYGAGTVGQGYYAQLCKYSDIDIVLWVDKSYDLYDFDFMKVSPVENVIDTDCDYILIAVLKENIVNEIKCELNSLLASSGKTPEILWFPPKRKDEHLLNLIKQEEAYCE